MKSNQDNYSEHNLDSEFSQKAISVWETHMKTFCSGRDSAFNLSSELIFTLDNSDHLHILDLACGYGGWSDFLQKASKEHNVKIEFTGMDGDEQRLKVYKEILGKSSNTIQGNILNTLPKLDEGSFDYALLGWASHEIEASQLEQIYKEVNQALKPKGILLMADFVSGLIPEVESLSTQLTKKLRESLMLDPESRNQEQWLKEINKQNHQNHSKHHHHGEHKRHKEHYFVKEHISFLNSAGFSVVEEVWRYMNSTMILAIK